MVRWKVLADTRRQISPLPTHHEGAIDPGVGIERELNQYRNGNHLWNNQENPETTQQREKAPRSRGWALVGSTAAEGGNRSNKNTPENPGVLV